MIRKNIHATLYLCDLQPFTSCYFIKPPWDLPIPNHQKQSLLPSLSTMCTTYELQYLHCRREVERDCKYAEHVPCESGMCKDDKYRRVTIEREEKCPVHRCEEKQATEMGRYNGKKREEWPLTDCKPM